MDNKLENLLDEVERKVAEIQRSLDEENSVLNEVKWTLNDMLENHTPREQLVARLEELLRLVKRHSK